MKNKHTKDPFNTRCWLSETITDPYQVLACLFFEAHVHDFRKLVKKLVHHAGGGGVYKRQSPADVLLYMKMIRSLIKAANVLKHKECSPVIINEGDLLNTKYYRSHYITADAWMEFPRHLSKKEYCNPYRAFQQFFNHLPVKDWVQYWEQVVEAALCRDDAFTPVAPLKVYSRLAKLVEAAHLVDVREVTHVGGQLKGRAASSP